MGYKLQTVNNNSNCWTNIIYVLGLISLYILIINIVSSLFGFNTYKKSNSKNKVRCPYKRINDKALITPIE